MDDIKMNVLQKYLNLQEVMLSLQHEGKEASAEKLREVMDVLWLELSIDQRDVINNEKYIYKASEIIILK